MQALRKFVAPELVMGQGAINLAGRYAVNFGAKRVLVVTDPGVQSVGWTARVVESLTAHGVQSVVFSDVSENPRSQQVMAGAKLYRECGCDVLVAVGGGSPMDCAKGIGIVAAEEEQRHVLDFEGVDKIDIPMPPLICIPTTSGSAADVSQFAIILDEKRHVKIAIISKMLVPDVSLLDPETLTTMSAELSACTGLDALTHAIEAYVSNAHFELADTMALEAIDRVAQYLLPSIAQPQQVELRNGMMLASLTAGLAFSNAILGAVHAMAHSLGGVADAPHGECNAILLGPVAAMNFSGAPERYREVAKRLHIVLPQDDKAAARALADGINALRRQAGLTRGLRELGVDRTQLRQLAENAMADPCMATNPRRVSVEEVLQLYEEIF